MVPKAALPLPWPSSRKSTTPALASTRAMSRTRPRRSRKRNRQRRATNTGYIKWRVVAAPTPM